MSRIVVPPLRPHPLTIMQALARVLSAAGRQRRSERARVKRLLRQAAK